MNPRRLAAWALVLSLAADLLPPPVTAAAPTPRTAPAGSGSYTAGSLLLAQADEDGYRPRRRRKRRASQADQTGRDAGKETRAAPPEEGPRTAAFPHDAALSLRDEAWRVTAGGGAVELVIAKGTFPADRDTSLTVRAVPATAPVASAPSGAAGTGEPAAARPPSVASAVYEIGFTARPAAPLLLRLRFDAAAPALRSDPRLATVVLLPPSGDPASARPVGGRVDRIAGTVEARIAEPGLYAVAARRPAFADLRAHPAAPEAILVAARGLMTGFPDGTFRPSTPLTRAQLARILATAAGQEGTAPGAPPTPAFADVPAAAWYAADAATVKALGLMLGQGDRFHPGAAVTRQELALVALRLAGIPPGPAPAAPPPPAAGAAKGTRPLAAAPRSGSAGKAGAVPPPPGPVADAHLAAPWAAGGLVTAVEAGFLAVDARRRARPRDAATRGEAALAIARALERRAFFEISTVVSGRLGKVHIPATYYEIRTADGRTYVLEPGAPDVDSSLRQALGGTLTATGYVNPASPYKIRGTALRTVKLAGVVPASDAPPASAAPQAAGRRRKKRPTVTYDEPNVNILDLEDTGVRRRRRKPVRTPPPTVQDSAYRSDEEERPARPRYRRKKKPAARPPQPKAQQPKAQPSRTPARR